MIPYVMLVSIQNKTAIVKIVQRDVLFVVMKIIAQNVQIHIPFIIPNACKFLKVKAVKMDVECVPLEIIAFNVWILIINQVLNVFKRPLIAMKEKYFKMDPVKNAMNHVKLVQVLQRMIVANALIGIENQINDVLKKYILNK